MANDKKLEKLELDGRKYRITIGLLLLPVAVFQLTSLFSYDWRDISALMAPPLTPAANLMGLVGAWSVYLGYCFMGLAVWLVPAVVLVFSALLLFGRLARAGRQALWMALFTLACGCLLQLGSEPLSGVMARLNMRADAGGMLGYWVMTRCLANWLNPFGSGLLMATVAVFALVMAAGVRNTLAAGRWLVGCLVMRRTADADEGGEDDGQEAGEADEGLSPRELKRQRKQEAREAKRLAREARDEERRRKREERDAERLRKKAEQEAAERERVPGSEDAIFRRVEEARRAAAVARERERGGGRAVVAEAPAAAAARPAAEKPARKKAVSVVASGAAGGVPPAEYPLPPVALLEMVPSGAADYGNVEETSAILVETLRQFNVPVEVIGTTPGPVVTQYELRPAPNIKVERIASLTANLQMALEATSLRVQAPIPGKNAVGIEIPNRRARPVTFREVLEGKAWKQCRMEIPLVLGKDVAGNDLLYDLAKAPHLLVAGSTGSGKSVCLNSILNGFLMCRTPEQLRLILVDPKRVEFTCYNDLPHLLVPVINDSKKVAFGLRWAIMEMEKRYRLLQRVGCRNIVAYNTRQVATQEDLFDAVAEDGQEATAEMPKTLPYIVIVVDEVADIMAAVGKEVEPAIARLTALSRAVGIHLILATQRPSVDVITGTIKSNIPGRIAFKVSQANDSRTILDNPGAEELIGKGDMLFLKEGSQLMRAQGAWVSDEEIARVVSYVKEHCQPRYDEALAGRLEKIKEADPDSALDDDEDEDAGEGAEAAEADSEDDELFENALEVIRMTRRASTTMLQRRLRIGYTRAARLMDTLEERGIVGPQIGAGTRELLVDLDNEIPANTLDDGSAAEEAPADGGGDFEDEQEMAT